MGHMVWHGVGRGVGTALVAGRESIAWASLASSLSKQGSPSPAGTFVQTPISVPPMLSLQDLTSRMRVAIRHAVGACGHRNGMTLSESSASTPSGLSITVPSRV